MHPGSIPGEASILLGRKSHGASRLSRAGHKLMEVDFSSQRVKMVDGQVRTTDVATPAITSAMLTVPREEFVPSHMRPLSYIDEDIQVAPGRYLMEPSPFAKLIQLAEIRPNDFVLDVGCGTGYSSAVISRIASSVVALENDPALAAAASETLSRLGYDNCAVVEGPLHEGLPAEAPFDVIFVGGAVDEVPQALLDQLREGGRLVVVVGEGNAGVATVYMKVDGVVSPRRAFNAAVRMLPGFRKEPAFRF